MYMEYAEYFSNLYEKYKDTSKDAVEDKKHFKYDFYNLVLDSLQIKEDYLTKIICPCGHSVIY